MPGNVRTAMWAGVLACAATVSITGCPSLDALECHGSACTDGSTVADGATGEAGSPTNGILCGGGTRCTPAAQECCFEGTSGTQSCAATFVCSGSDIFCDDPSQCPGGGTCWICITTQGFQGTSCDYQNDIVHNDHCDQTTALALCHDSSQCEGGTTCKPLPVAAFDAGADASWFEACQP
jgi:hypothetical protein